MTARLHVPPERLAAGQLEVSGDDHAYLFRARRLAVGDRVDVFDGSGREAPAVVVAIGPSVATLEVGMPAARTTAGPRITVLQALSKGERMDWCLEKLVEVGVDRIVLCATERCVVRLQPLAKPIEELSQTLRSKEIGEREVRHPEAKRVLRGGSDGRHDGGGPFQKGRKYTP